jgi:hypothetical protein
LAFLEPNDVFSYFKVLEAELIQNNNILSNLNCFHEYFKRMYIGSSEEDKDAIFPIHFWNVHHRILKSVPRTTNASEGFHRSLNNNTYISHPNIARFINILQ